MITRRWRTTRWVLLALAAITAFAAVSAWLTAPRLGGRMDPSATSPLGGHALVALLRDQGVEVVIAETVADAQRAARPDTLLLIAETANTRGDALSALAAVPGDRLLVEPTTKSRETLAAGIRRSSDGKPANAPECQLREAELAGTVDFSNADSYEQVGDTSVIRCYGGAVIRYTADGRVVTAVGSADFMTNGALLNEGGAALAMNLAGQRSRLIWYAPQHVQGSPDADKELGDLIPVSVTWVVLQLCVVVALLAVWQGRRLGPLVAERLPVVVRASETVEGRARLYRSRRARGQAAAALRTATLQRTAPRLGLGTNPPETAVVTAIAQRCRMDESSTHRAIFGPPPETDTELFDLAQTLDAIERQVRQS